MSRACVHGFVDKSTDSIDALRAAIMAIESGQSYFSKTYWDLQGHRQHTTALYDNG